MKARHIPWLVGIITVAMIVVIGVQLSWLQSTAALRQEVFDRSVDQSLQQFASWLTREELDPQPENDATLVIADGYTSSERRIRRILQADSVRVANTPEAIGTEALLTKALQEHGVNVEIVAFGVFDSKGQSIHLDESSEAYREELLSQGYVVKLETLELRVYFPGLTRNLLGQMKGAFAVSIVMMLIIASVVGFTLRAVLRTKRMDRLQRDLVNNLTHELKTPISSIGLATEALADPAFDKDTRKRYLGLIQEENRRLGVLVDNVLRASLSESGAMRLYPQSMNLHDLVKEVVSNMAVQLHKQGVKIQLALDAPNPMIQGDRIHLTNVLNNLIDNAIKYSQQDAKIVILTSQHPGGVSLEVKDNGIGIAKEHLGKVFDRLYRVPTGNVHNVKGFGLGLSYVKNVIEHHGGIVSIESQVGEGTTLKLRLPFDTQPDKT